ncbi:MAG: cyclic nucleotide-binding domain-containing protein [Acidimicrobiia bacterium]|nr:cyclic nucleotide-binding domain-containing protein [Acidimicrobiia bacterium]MBT8246296.1 cyclic nucleotide-binding domain-containing protein [Acidimicrobiia bacterium]NNF87856.1 cyclic nucleotide-binding domain-containing protein [Acidimicrobiia bacterium]NNL12798.1 cyclic nucleotide-binding domain-containing protein [Acidimicrobiia bacterium]RZV46846.1 MAG: cyclic nucleotide-binding domain-containing protein [Acidimicrobiia bacterium]
MRLTNQKQRIEALRRIPVLAGLSRAMLGDLAHRTEDVEVPAGAYLTRQGALGTEAYVVLDGSFAVRRHTRTVANRKKGDVFGEMSLIDGMPRGANVVAEKDSHVLVVHKKDFETLLATPRVAKRVMRELATRLQDADDSIFG